MNSTAHGPGLLSSSGARIVILERPGCHLCEVAATTVHAIAREFGEKVEHVNIDGSEELARRWQIEIPVIAIDGSVVSVYRAEPAKIRAALTKKPGSLLQIIRSLFRITEGP